MPYFHATTVEALPSILATGLGAVDPGPRSEDCVRGVYLASHPTLAVHIAFMHLLNTWGDDEVPARVALDAVRVFVIDDTRLDPARLQPDPQVRTWAGSWLYAGVIDVGGLPVLTAHEAMRGGSLLDPDTVGWRTLDAPG
jgi:hypothetical protein